MNRNVKVPDSLPGFYLGEERRRKARIYSSFSAVVRGVDASGKLFKTNATLENLSATGTYLRIAEQVEKGAKIFLIAQISQRRAKTTTNVAVKGTVSRVEAKPDGTSGVAVEILRHRLL